MCSPKLVGMAFSTSNLPSALHANHYFLMIRPSILILLASYAPGQCCICAHAIMLAARPG